MTNCARYLSRRAHAEPAWLPQVFRTSRGVLYQSTSADGAGRSWTDAAPMRLPNPNSKARALSHAGHSRIAQCHTSKELGMQVSGTVLPVMGSRNVCAKLSNQRMLEQSLHQAAGTQLPLVLHVSEKHPATLLLMMIGLNVRHALLADAILLEIMLLQRTARRRTWPCCWLARCCCNCLQPLLPQFFSCKP